MIFGLVLMALPLPLCGIVFSVDTRAPVPSLSEELARCRSVCLVFCPSEGRRAWPSRRDFLVPVARSGAGDGKSVICDLKSA